MGMGDAHLPSLPLPLPPLWPSANMDAYKTSLASTLLSKPLMARSGVATPDVGVGVSGSGAVADHKRWQNRANLANGTVGINGYSDVLGAHSTRVADTESRSVSSQCRSCLDLCVTLERLKREKLELIGTMQSKGTMLVSMLCGERGAHVEKCAILCLDLGGCSWMG